MENLSQLEQRESESLYRAIVESQIDLVCRYLPDTTLTYVNDAYCAFFGKRREELIGQSFLMLASPESHPGIFARLAEVCCNPRPAVREFWGRGSDGRHVCVQWVDHGITDAQGHVLMIQSVGRDITRLKEVEAALIEQEQRYRTLFERNPMPMWVFDAETFEVLEVNDAAVATYGYSRDEFLHMPLHQMQPFRQMTSAYVHSASNGHKRSRVWQHTRHDGSLIEVEVVISEMVYDGRPACMALTIDVTERKQLERERLYARSLELELDKERELVEMRERFTSIVSHEFRTPLAIILSSADVVTRYFDKLSREHIFEKLEVITEQVHRMGALLEDVLAVSKGQANKLEVRWSRVSLGDVCRAIVDNMRMTDNNAHHFDISMDSRLGLIDSDRRMLEHILINLLSNAIKYSPAGTTIRFSVMLDGDDAVITIADEGIGIPAEDHSQLFQPFHRARNVGAIEGTGLGLTIVKQNVDLLHGTITMESVEGRGTTFTVRLPRHIQLS